LTIVFNGPGVNDTDETGSESIFEDAYSLMNVINFAEKEKVLRKGVRHYLDTNFHCDAKFPARMMSDTFFLTTC
jgi:hypothetical protein